MNDVKEKIVNLILIGIYIFTGIFILKFITNNDFQQNAFLDKFYLTEPIEIRVSVLLYIFPMLLTLNSIVIENKYHKIVERENIKIVYHSVNLILLIVFACFSMIFHDYLYLLIYALSILIVVNTLIKFVKISILLVYSFFSFFIIVYMSAILGFIKWFNFTLKDQILVNETTGNYTNILFKESVSNRNFVDGYFYNSTILDTNFENCNLNGASFTKAVLSDIKTGQVPNFRNTKLKNTSFKAAHLYFADFSNAEFENTDFTDSKLEGCHFNNVDLRKCKGLTIDHFQNIELHQCNVPQFVLDSVESNPKRFETIKYLLKKNISYKK